MTQALENLPGEPGSTDPLVAGSEPAPALAKPGGLSTPYLLFWFILLLVLAAFLRFWRISQQSYWTDEGYTIERVRDTFQHLLSSLTDQGFTPAWYVLLRQWCLSIEAQTHNGAFAFSPASTRSLTALFGTLTVPAMYLLARQFMDRKGALVVMLLAAVNPFLIYYSRDIKMYAPLYFFVTLNMALFFLWLTASARNAWWHLIWWPLFVITAACVTALHPMGWFIPAIQFIFLLTRPIPRWYTALLQGLLWFIATAAAAAFPIWWFCVYEPNLRFVHRVQSDTNMGMGWLASYTDMSWKTVAGLGTEHVLGYLWPVNPPDARIVRWFNLGSDFKDHLATRSWDWLARWQVYLAAAIAAIMLLGLIPWRGIRKRGQIAERDRSSTRARWWWIPIWIAIPVGVLALTWLPPGPAALAASRTPAPQGSRVVIIDGRPVIVAPSVATKPSPPEDHTWYHFFWRDFNPKPIWEPRYLGIIVPALLLWLGAALRRLPSWPLRVLATIFVADACLICALPNFMLYRNPPLNRAATIAERYTDPANREATAIAIPYTNYSQPAADAEYAVIRGVRPGSPEDKQAMGSNVWDELQDDPDSIRQWLQQHRNTDTKTIVLTDREGDLTAAGESLSTDSLNRVLGARWKLVDEERYQWHYEWRFYIFHTWRTRVWQRQN